MNADKARARAEAVLTKPADRYEKGSAIGIIAAEHRAVQEKTERLRKLRMEREAVEAAEPPKPKAKRAAASPKKATRAKKPAA